jgi:type VI secretion system protein ImpB
MAKDEASIAPKERVNIRLPAATPGGEGEELPLRMAIVGDFTGKASETGVGERDIKSITSKNFNDVMASMEISTTFNVKNKVGGKEDEEIPVDLKIESMRSFRPEEVAKQVPQLKELVELRQRLVYLRGKAATDPAVLKEFNDLLKSLGWSGK